MQHNAWMDRFRQKGAYWVHDGNSRRPHALLTSGDHSSGFFNSEMISEDPILLDEASHTLAVLVEEIVKLVRIKRVVGPAMGAIRLAHSLAVRISNRKNRTCLSGYTQDGVFKRTLVQVGEEVLCCEDVITTGASLEKTIRAVEDAGGIAIDVVVALVNRSNLTEVRGHKIISLISREMPVWKPEECPLCKEGSEALRPKEAGNWAKLNQTY